MIDYVKQHSQFAILLVIWVLSGIYGGPAYLGVIPLSMMLLKMRNMYVELICGFFMIIILSDSWNESMLWAGKIKDIYLVLLTLFLVFNRKQFQYTNTLVYIFIPYFILASILILRSPDIETCILKTISFILVYTILPIYYLKLLNEDRDRFLKGLVYTITLLLLYGFVMIFLFYDAAYLKGRYRGAMGNPNGIGILCTVFFAFFTIVISKRKDLFQRWEVIIVYGAILLSVVLAGSRNSLMSILIFYAFSRFFKVSYFLGFTVIIVLAIVYQVVITNLPLIIATFGLQEYLRVEHIEDGSGRIVAWIFGWQKIQENFFIGRGFNYEGWLYVIYSPYLYKLGHIGNSHNSWLAIWLNTGLIGLVLFLIGLIYRFVKAATKSPFALPLMYSVIFSATFEAWLVGSLNPHTPLLLLMWTIMSLNLEKEEKNQEEEKPEKEALPQLAT